MPDRHAERPVCFRPAPDDRAWLLAHAKATGQAVNAILAEALSRLRSQLSPDPREAGQEEER